MMGSRPAQGIYSGPVDRRVPAFAFDPGVLADVDADMRRVSRGECVHSGRAITGGVLYRIVDAVDPRLVGEVVSLEQVLPCGDVRVDPEYMGEHWWLTVADGVVVVPA